MAGTHKRNSEPNFFSLVKKGFISVAVKTLTFAMMKISRRKGIEGVNCISRIVFLALIKKPFVQAFALVLAVVFILRLVADLLIMPIIAGFIYSESQFLMFFVRKSKSRRTYY
jgi:hypothetical protein